MHDASRAVEFALESSFKQRGDSAHQVGQSGAASIRSHQNPLFYSTEVYVRMHRGRYRCQNESRGGGAIKRMRQSLKKTFGVKDRKRQSRGEQEAPFLSEQTVPPADTSAETLVAEVYQNRSATDTARWLKCVALASEADGISDSIKRLGHKLDEVRKEYKDRPLRRTWSILQTKRRIAQRSLRSLMHSLSMRKCRSKYKKLPNRAWNGKLMWKDDTEQDFTPTPGVSISTDDEFKRGSR